jgi:hypothetical protein
MRNIQKRRINGVYIGKRSSVGQNQSGIYKNIFFDSEKQKEKYMGTKTTNNILVLLIIILKNVR